MSDRNWEPIDQDSDDMLLGAAVRKVFEEFGYTLAAEKEATASRTDADAELGRALREAREAWGDPMLHTERAVYGHNGEPASWGVYTSRWCKKPNALLGSLVADGATEIEALRAATKAAEERG